MNLLYLLSIISLASGIPHPLVIPEPKASNNINHNNNNNARFISPAIDKANTIKHNLGAMVAKDPAETMPNPPACPSTHRAKQCCTSINETAHDVTGGLADAVPLLGGVQVSSTLGLQCVQMKDAQANSDCFQSVMCCSGRGPPVDDLALSNAQCVPYKEAIGGHAQTWKLPDLLG